MSENMTEVLVGGAVLAAAAGFLFYAGQVTNTSAGGDAYELTASFRSVEGIALGSDVRMAGVKVGAVRSMGLNPDTFRADIALSVAEGISVPEDSTLQISSEGLLGGNFMEIVPGGSPIFLEPGGEIYDTQGAISLVSLLATFAGGGGEDE